MNFDPDAFLAKQSGGGDVATAPDGFDPDAFLSKVESGGGAAFDHVAFIKDLEGFTPRAYEDHNQLSIGYGTRARGQYELIDEDAADARLRQELSQHESNIDEAAKRSGYQLTPRQRGALISFDFNTGEGANVLDRAAGDLSKVSEKLPLYTKAGGQFVQGLANRRAKELALFNDGGNSRDFDPDAFLAKQHQFETRLSPQEEQDFVSWKAKYAPTDSGADYDLRGAFKAGLTPDPVSGHWPDTFKKPNHPTFSNESIYASAAPQRAGRWNGDTFIKAFDPDAFLAKVAPRATVPTANERGILDLEQRGDIPPMSDAQRLALEGTMNTRASLGDIATPIGAQLAAIRGDLQIEPGTLSGLAKSGEIGARQARQTINAQGVNNAAIASDEEKQASAQLAQYERDFSEQLQSPDAMIRLEAELRRKRLQSRVAQLGAERDQRAGYVPDAIQAIAAEEKNIGGAQEQLSKPVRDFFAANGMDAAKAFVRNPIEITANVVLQSMLSTAPTIAGATGAGVLAGPPGTALVMGAGSAAQEYSSSILDALRDAGVDLEDPAAIATAFKDPDILATARAFAVKRAVPVGAFDAATAGLAGRILHGALGKGTLRVAAASAKELGVQMLGGAAGESAGQLATGKYDPKAVALEAIGELGSPEIIGNIREDLAARRSGKLQPNTANVQPGAATTPATAESPRAREAFKWDGTNLGERPVIAFRTGEGNIYADPAAGIHAEAASKMALVGERVEPGFIINGKFMAGSQDGRNNPRALAARQAQGNTVTVPEDIPGGNGAGSPDLLPPLVPDAAASEDPEHAALVAKINAENQRLADAEDQQRRDAHAGADMRVWHSELAGDVQAIDRLIDLGQTHAAQIALEDFLPDHLAPVGEQPRSWTGTPEEWSARQAAAEQHNAAVRAEHARLLAMAVPSSQASSSNAGDLQDRGGVAGARETIVPQNGGSRGEAGATSPDAAEHQRALAQQSISARPTGGVDTAQAGVGSGLGDVRRGVAGGSEVAGEAGAQISGSAPRAASGLARSLGSSAAAEAAAARKRLGYFRTKLPAAPGGADFIESLLDLVGPIKSVAAIKRRGRQPGGEYDGAAYLPRGVWQQVLFSPSSGVTPDEAAQTLHDQGLLRENSPDALWEELQKAINSRRSQGKASKERSAAQKQDERFNKDARDPDRNADEPKLHVDILNVGDTVEVHGEPFLVKNVDPDGNVILEDGKKYGVQKVERGEAIFAELTEHAGVQTGDEPPRDTPFLRSGPGSKLSADERESLRGLPANKAETAAVALAAKHLGMDLVAVGSPARALAVAKGTRRQARRAEALAGAFGKRIVWFLDQKQLTGGFVLNGERRLANVLFINAADADPALRTAAHELAHKLEGDDPKLYTGLLNYLRLGADQRQEFDAELRKKGYSDSELDHELVARTFERVLEDPASLERVLGNEPRLIDKLISFVRRWIRRAQQALGLRKLDAANALLATSEMERFSKAVEEVAKVYKERVGAARPREVQTELGLARFSRTANEETLPQDKVLGFVGRYGEENPGQVADEIQERIAELDDMRELISDTAAAARESGDEAAAKQGEADAADIEAQIADLEAHHERLEPWLDAGEEVAQGQPNNIVHARFARKGPPPPHSIIHQAVRPARWRDVRWLYQGAADIFDRTKGLEFLGRAIRKHVDQARMYQGQLTKPFREWTKKWGSKERREALRGFQAYQQEMGRGDRLAADNIRRTVMNDAGRELLGLWDATAKRIDARNQLRGIKVKTEKAWRPIGSVRDYFPRLLRREVMQALTNPSRNKKEYEATLDDLVKAKLAKDRDEAARIIQDRFKRTKQFDYLGNIEHERRLPLPHHLYDYSFDAALRYIRGWSERMGQIEAYGQKTTRDSQDLFDVAKDRTSDRPTSEYIDAVRDRAYQVTPNTILARLASGLNALATGTMLGNPITVGVNLGSGLGYNVHAFGVRRSLAALLELHKIGDQIDDAYEKGVLLDDLMSMHQDLEALVTDTGAAPLVERIHKVSAGLLKWSGYNVSEEFVRAHGLVAAKAFLRDALKAHRHAPAGRAAQSYVRAFERLHIDAAKLFAEGGSGPIANQFYRAAINNVQGGYRFDQVPVFMDTPGGRFLFKYQKWGSQALRYFATEALAPLRRGNPLPLIKYLLITGVVGGSLEALKELLFGRPDATASFAEIRRTWNERDHGKRRAIALAAAKLARYQLAAGAAGILGNYIQIFADAYERSRFKNPMDPPGLFSLFAVGEQVMRLVEQKKLTPADLDEFLRATLSQYRTGKAFAARMTRMASAPAGPLKGEINRQDIAWLRTIERRFAAESGLEGNRTTVGRTAVTGDTAIRRELSEALLSGDRAGAKRARDEYVSRSPARDRERALVSLKGSVTAKQPVRVGGHAGGDARATFLAWARRRLDPEDYARVKRLDAVYHSTAEGVGLMSPEKPDVDLDAAMDRVGWKARRR